MSHQDFDRYFSEIINGIHEGIIIIGPDGTILLVNRAMEILTGFAAEEMLGSSCTILGCDVCRIIRSEKELRWCTLFVNERVRNKRCMLLNKDNYRVPSIKDASLLRDKSGKVIGALEIYQNIADIEEKEMKILELTRSLHRDKGFCGMLGDSHTMRELFQIIEKAALTDVAILISGESGTGKELVADCLHEKGKRKSGPFVKMNCAAMNESLIESELFGHTKGSFTGAYQHRKGLFEAAHGGEIFLDEIGDMPLSTQAKILRVIETKQLQRIGGQRSIVVDVRIITATNRNLSDMVSQGQFRADLFYRINAIAIHLPPLRERKEDIPILAFSMLDEFRKKFNRNIGRISSYVMDLFMCYDWPGNVRELRNVLEYASIYADSPVINLSHLSLHYREIFSNLERSLNSPLKVTDDPDEKQKLMEALRKTSGNQTRAAKLLGVHRMTVWHRMRKYGINRVNPVLKA